MTPPTSQRLTRRRRRRQAPRLVLRAGAFTLLGVAVSVFCSGLSGLGVTAASGPGFSPTGSALPAAYVGQLGEARSEEERAANPQRQTGQTGQPAEPGTPGSASTSSPSTSGRVDGVPCQVVRAPRSLGLSSFYEQVCVVQGLPVVSSSQVEGAALVEAAVIVQGMLQARPDLARKMAERRFRLGVIGVGELAVELPEYRDLPTSYPNTDWEAARAYGATVGRPLAAAPEENLLCTAKDTYPGQSVLTHELGHSVLDMAVVPDDPGFDNRVRAAFRAASQLDVYQNTYAMTNADEYWAEGVQDFFDSSRAAYGPNGGGDGYDSPIYSRATLRTFDPTLYGLIAEVFTEIDWRPTCPTG